MRWIKRLMEGWGAYERIQNRGQVKAGEASHQQAGVQVGREGGR
jgi:hypothetical protein